MIFLILKKTKIIIESKNKKFNEKFGTFFEEFTDKITAERLFYVIFVFRRFGIVLISLYITSPIIQLSISFCFSVSVSAI
jgi:hypothetical protein